MSRGLLVSGQTLWIISFLILPLPSSCEASSAGQLSKVLTWCTQKHCEDCGGSEDFLCTNGAQSSRFGDLCGCCHSCVQIRDLGASCGSQLALRTSSANFEDSRSRVTVLATTRCGAGLVCTNFICEFSDDRLHAAPVERDDEKVQWKLKTSKVGSSEESDDLESNLISDGKAEKSYYPHRNYDFEIKQRLISKTTSAIGIDKNEIPPTRRNAKRSDIEFETSEAPDQIKNEPESIPDTSGHFVNVIIANREFQLIYENEALLDLQILLNSIDKNQATSIFQEIEAALVYERFRNVIEQLNSTRKASVFTKGAANVSTTAVFHGQSGNKTTQLIKSIRNSEALADPRQFMIPRSLKFTRLRLPTRIFRRKRELENTDQSNSRGEYSEIVVYDFLNNTPRTMQDSSRHWLIARQVGTDSEEKFLTSQSSEPEGMESAINIHITGRPRSAKSSGDFDPVEEAETRGRRTVTAGEDYANYDDELEIFVTDSSTELPEFSRTDEDQRNSSNFTISSVSQGLPDLEDESGEIYNITEKYWDTSINSDENSRYSDNNYEFTFPENPVVLENDDYHDYHIRINETVDEFKAQLDRIETKIVVIESSVYDMITKIEANERSKNVENGKIPKNSPSTIFPHSRKNFAGSRRKTAINRSPKIVEPEELDKFIRRYVLLPKPKVIYHPNENSTATYPRLLASNRNGRNFNVEDEGVAQFIPIRSPRRWRTVTLQPSAVEAQNILRARGRRYRSQNGRNRAKAESQPGRRTETQRVSNPEHQETTRSNVRKVPKDDPIHEAEQSQSPISFLNADTRSFSSTKSPNLFSRERYSLRFDADPPRTSRPVVWPLNPAWNRLLSLDKSKRRSTNMNRRGGSNSEIGETPPIEETISMLETQIPKSVVRARMSEDFDKRMAESSSRLGAMMPMATSMRHSFNDENDWNRNSWDGGHSLNLFVVNGESKSEFNGEAPSSFRESYETPVLPMENENSEVENSWQIAYPAYLDYSERLQSDEEPSSEVTPIVETEATEPSTNLRRSRRIGAESVERKKRDADDVSQAEKVDETIFSRSNNKSMNRKRKIEEKRSKRTVQMVDWLRAAQEYHERLHQVRNAALRTWLASREELADGNLTNVKLFTREIPSYLEKYTPSFTAEDETVLKSESSHDDPRIAMFDDGESFTEFSPNQASALLNGTKSNSSKEIDSSVARKFTIIATGNSTIKIEELPEIDKDDRDSLFVDQSAEDSNDSELAVARQMAFATSDSEDFDHMYESVDAEDEDFDYGDPNFALSRWLDEVDIIDASSVEIPDDKTKSGNDDSSNVEEDYEVDELLSRTKRDTPLLLFKVKGNPRQDVVVWPSNWKDFINRHFQRNRTRSSSTTSTRTAKRILKMSKNVGSSKIANPDDEVRTSLDRDAVMLASETTSPEEDEKDSSLEFDFARRLQHAFDNLPRQRRKNRYHRNILSDTTG